MKWTLVSTLALALFVYGLLFAIHASRRTSSSTRPGPVSSVEGLPATAASSSPGTMLAKEPPSVSGTAEDIDLVATGSSAMTTGPTSAATARPSSGGKDLAVGRSRSAVDREAASSSAPDGSWATGCRLYEEGEYAAARTVLERAVAQAENRPGRHYLLGLTALHLGDADSAVDELERAIELDPSSLRAHVNLGRAFLAQNDPLSAREAIDAALDIDLGHADAWEVLGRVECTQGHLPEAEAAFTKAVQISPEHAWAWNNLGYVRILQGCFADALAPLERAVALSAERPVFENNLGVARERTGDLVAAAAAYTAAAQGGHPTAQESAQRVEDLILARTRVPSAPADSLSPKMAAATADSTRW